MQATKLMNKAREEAFTFADVKAARERIRESVHRTPVSTSTLVNKRTGREVFFKWENIQRGGSFKIRGASNFLLSLSETDRKRGVVAFSSGNHAQGVAMAAAALGVPATIVMPDDAPKAKLEATASHNPKIVLHDRHKVSRESIADKIAEETGAVVVPSFDHPWIAAGQGTATLELLEDVPDLDALVICVGGGGLISGGLITAEALNPEIAVFGSEPELASDTYQSFRSGERIEIKPPSTIADGLRTQAPGKITFPIVERLARDILLVSEAEIKATVRFLLTRMKQLVEPSGAVAGAAVLFEKLPKNYKRVGVMISGGNVDLDVLAAICSEQAELE